MLCVCDGLLLNCHVMNNCRAYVTANSNACSMAANLAKFAHSVLQVMTVMLLMFESRWCITHLLGLGRCQNVGTGQQMLQRSTCILYHDIL